MKQNEEITIRNTIRSGDLGYLVYLHGILYAKEYGFDSSFETYVAIPLAEFIRSHTERERIWIVERRGEIVGSVAIVKVSDRQAQLRWLLLSPELRGRGIGKRLMEEAVSFSRECGYSSLFLWTVDLLQDAARLYTLLGFHLTEEKKHRVWGVDLTEQRYDLKL